MIGLSAFLWSALSLSCRQSRLASNLMQFSAYARSLFFFQTIIPFSFFWFALFSYEQRCVWILFDTLQGKLPYLLNYWKVVIIHLHLQTCFILFSWKRFEENVDLDILYILDGQAFFETRKNSRFWFWSRIC